MNYSIYLLNLISTELEFGCDFCSEHFATRADRKEHTVTHFLSKLCSSCRFPLVKIADDWYIIHNEELCVDGISNENAETAAALEIFHVQIKPDELGPVESECDNIVADELNDFTSNWGSEFVSTGPSQAQGCDNVEEWTVLVATKTTPLNTRVVRRRRDSDVRRRSVKYKSPSVMRTRCRLCQKILRNAYCLKRHINSVHQNAPNKEVVIEPDDLIDDDYVEDRKFKRPSLTRIRCKLCRKILRNVFCLKRHISSVHKNAPHNEVVIEPDDLIDDDYVEDRMLKRRSLTRIRCKLCKKILKNVFSLKRHMKVRHKDAPNEEIVIEAHDLIEDEQKPNRPSLSRVRCKICTKILRSMFSFRRHMKTRHKDAPIDELNADQFDYVEDDFIEMPKVAQSRTRIRCKICKLILRNVYSLKRHMKSIHKAEPNSEVIIGQHELINDVDAMQSEGSRSILVEIDYSDLKCLEGSTRQYEQNDLDDNESMGESSNSSTKKRKRTALKGVRCKNM